MERQLKAVSAAAHMPSNEFPIKKIYRSENTNTGRGVINPKRPRTTCAAVTQNTDQ
jgi:hypothetical protein